MRLMLALPLILLPVLPTSAIAQDRPADEEGFSITAGSGIVSSRSKIDRLLPSKNAGLFIINADLTRESGKVNLSGKLADTGLSPSTSFSFSSRTNLLSVHGLKVGFGAEYFFAREHEPLIREPELLVDSDSKKHYLLGGPDIVYGNMRGRYIRGAYLLGATYMRIDGVFQYNNPGNDVPYVQKLYNLDTQPVHALMVGGAYTNLWRLKLAGSLRFIRTLEVVGHKNGKNLIPSAQLVSEGSLETRVWRSLSVSASGTFSNNDRGRIFIGDSVAILTKFSF